jgi:hypothetical protein
LLPCRLPLLRLEQLPLIDRCVLLHLLAIQRRVLLDERLILLDLLLVLRCVLLHLALIGGLILLDLQLVLRRILLHLPLIGALILLDLLAMHRRVLLLLLRSLRLRELRRVVLPRAPSPVLVVAVPARPVGISPTHIDRRPVVGGAAVFVTRWRYDIGRVRTPAGIAGCTSVIAIPVAPGIGRVGAGVRSCRTTV